MPSVSNRKLPNFFIFKILSENIGGGISRNEAFAVCLE